MFGKLFRKRPPRSIDELIFEIAEHKRDADFDEFYARMRSHMFFVPLEAPLVGTPGAKIRTGAGVQTRTAMIQNMKLFAFFTTRDHPHLGPVFGGIDGVEALRMTLASAEIDGALFHNAKASWIGLDKQKCEYVLALVPEAARS